MIYRVEYMCGLGIYRNTEDHWCFGDGLASFKHRADTFRPILPGWLEGEFESGELLFGFKDLAQVFHWFSGIGEHVATYQDVWCIKAIEASIARTPDDYQVLFRGEYVTNEYILPLEEVEGCIKKWDEVLELRQEYPYEDLLMEFNE